MSEQAVKAFEVLSGRGLLKPQDDYAAFLAGFKAGASGGNLPGAVALPVEPSVAVLTSMSVALGIQPLGDGSDGSYPITGAQSTVRQCYDALVVALQQAS